LFGPHSYQLGWAIYIYIYHWKALLALVEAQVKKALNAVRDEDTQKNQVMLDTENGKIGVIWLYNT